MSDSNASAATRRSMRRSRDSGLTLPELLITISILGIVVTVLASSVVVSLRQQASTEGRLNVARDEQAIGFVMPSDLASASEVSTDPWATPCDGAKVCDGIDLSSGSNVVMLSWVTEEGGILTEINVSYHFAPSGDGLTYQLSRIECRSVDGTAWSCTSRVVMRDLPGPPGGAAFIAGVDNGVSCQNGTLVCTRPDWVIEVSEPLAPDAVNDTQFASDDEKKDANRVVVSIDGGGDSAGAGGGLNQVNITAGGTVRDEIDATSLDGTPAFVAARSRCGGPITLIVDDSGSIGSTAMQQVRDGVEAFVSTLAGTPTQIQVVRFDTTSGTLGTTGWHRYFDMRVDTDVTELLDAVDGTSTKLISGGLTNWEDALYRTFYAEDGTIPTISPQTVVFFTDGVPSYNRLEARSTTQPLPLEPPAPGPGWPAPTGAFHQVSFDRADYIANEFAARTRLIGVGVGSGITPDSNGNAPTSTWIEDPGGERTLVERGSYSYVKAATYFGQFQIRQNSRWNTVDLDTYESWDGRKRFFDSIGQWIRVRRATNTEHLTTELGWFEITESVYDAVNVTDDDSDGLTFSDDTVPVSTGEYNANAGEANYQAVDKTYSADGPDWETWTDPEVGDPATYRYTTITSDADSYPRANSAILGDLIADTDTGVPAEFDPVEGRYTNVETANMYLLPRWDQFQGVMTQIALGECGGTLTLRTELPNGSPAPDPFEYVSGGFLDSNDQPLDFVPETVETSQQFISGTYDFTVPNGQYVSVEVVPTPKGDVSAYTSTGWSCRAGIADRAFELIDPTDAGKGIRVEVGANEAVSCTNSVTT
ncbi:MAG: VWA domain-containing protein [Actinomycetota bacterium]